MAGRSNTVDTIIVGGGISGLSCAFNLSERGQSVLLVDPQRLGGVIQSKQVDGFSLELGPNVLLAKPDFANLIEKLDLKDSLVYPAIEPYQQLVWFRNRVVPVPKSLGAFLLSPLMNWRDKLRLFDHLIFNSSFIAELDDESVDVFCARIIGSSGVDNILDPVLRGIYGGDVGQLSARSIFSGLWDSCLAREGLRDVLRKQRQRGSTKIFVLRGGNQALVDRLQQKLDKRVQFVAEAVTAVRRSSSSFRYSIHTSADRAYYCDNVVIATSGRVSAGVLGGLGTNDPSNSSALSDLLFRLQNLRYCSLFVVHLATREKKTLPRNAFGLLFPSRSRSTLMGIMFNSVLFPHLAPSDQDLLTVCIGGTAAQTLAALEDEELLRRLRHEIEHCLGIRDLRILSRHSWSSVIPQYDKRHYRLVERMRLLEKDSPGLYFIGADQAGVGVADRVACGMRVAPGESEKLPATEVAKKKWQLK